MKNNRGVQKQKKEVIKDDLAKHKPKSKRSTKKRKIREERKKSTKR